MDAKTFLEKHGRDKCVEVAMRAGTNIAYFSQIAHGHRRPSVELAHKLVGASQDMIAAQDERLDLLSLLQPKSADRAA
jgi:transcriptional regulator with XRE-family HTH domain